jgi:hypothetical protein
MICRSEIGIGGFLSGESDRILRGMLLTTHLSVGGPLRVKAGEGKIKAAPPRRHRIGVCTSFFVEA